MLQSIIGLIAIVGLLALLAACGPTRQRAPAAPATATARTGTATPVATPQPAGDNAQEGGGAGLVPFQSFGLWINALLFAVAAAVIWFAGTRLERYTDAIANRTGMGQAFAGLLLLATATSLPEIATTTTATLTGNVQLAVYNLLGGVVMQTALIAVADLLVGEGAITHFTPRFSLLMEGVGLVLILGVALATMVVGGLLITVTIGDRSVGFGAGALALLGVYLLVMYVTHRAQGQPRWRPTPSDHQAGDGEDRHEQGQPARQDDQGQGDDQGTGKSLGKPALLFGLAALAVLVAGWAVARTGEALAGQTGLGTSFIGFTLVAIATSLPELSTTTAAARHKRYSMAISNIFGSNAFDVALLFLVALLAGGAVFQSVPAGALFAASLGIIMTCVYLWGMLEHSDRTVLRMGWDSAAVLVLYAGGLVALYLLR